MMKNIKIIALLIGVMAIFGSCESEDRWPASPIGDTSVYFVTDMKLDSGTQSSDAASNAAYTIYYQDGNVVLWQNSTSTKAVRIVESFTSTNSALAPAISDSYDMSFNEISFIEEEIIDYESGKVIGVNNIRVTRKYEISKSADGEAMLTITEPSGASATYTAVVTHETRTKDL